VVVTSAGIDALMKPVAPLSLNCMDSTVNQWLASFDVRNIVNAVGVFDDVYRETLDCLPLVFTGTF
jgi:hypothetical protein